MSQNDHEQFAQQLSELRHGIDELDTQLIDILAKRAELTSKVGEVKAKTGMPIYVPEREAQMLEATTHYHGLCGIMMSESLRLASQVNGGTI